MKRYYQNRDASADPGTIDDPETQNPGGGGYNPGGGSEED
jgi:hypothetical protein